MSGELAGCLLLEKKQIESMKKNVEVLVKLEEFAINR